MKYPVVATMPVPPVTMIVPSRILGFAIVLVLCCSLAFSQTPQSQIEPIASALTAKDYDKAVELSRAALQVSPNSSQLWTLQGIALVSKGSNKLALIAFQRALKISPDNIAALAGAGQIEYQAGNPSAIALLNHLLQLRPEDPTANTMLAVLEYRQGNCAEAVPHFEKAGGLIDSQLDALHAFATCLVKLKRLDEAATTFQRALALRPDDPRERRVLASIQLMDHKPQDALVTLQPLLASPDVDSTALQLASGAYEDTGDTPQAVALLRRAILLDPKNPSPYLDFANICFNHQSFQVGVDVMTDGLSVQPRSDELYVARGVLYVQLAQYDKAEADFEKAYDLNPNQSLSTAAQGLVAIQANGLDQALTSIQAKLQRKPNDPILLYLQAHILSQKGVEPGTPDFKLAMRSAKTAISLQPSLADAREVLAKLDMQTGQYQEAIEQCRKVLVSNPDDQTAVYRLIQALRKTGQTKEIPDLLQRLAKMREKATQDERERSRYHLYEDDSSTTDEAAPPASQP
jgi:tetratricopeptide (TPR) repeat protein